MFVCGCKSLHPVKCEPEFSRLLAPSVGDSLRLQAADNSSVGTVHPCGSKLDGRAAVHAVVVSLISDVIASMEHHRYRLDKAFLEGPRTKPP